MRELTIGKNDAGQRLDRFVAKNLPLLPPALLQKYIRLKRVKLNGKGAKQDVRLSTGDIIQLYINDEFFDKPSEENLFLTLFRPQLHILYEDENLLLVDKRPGQVVHADETEKVNTLINHIQAYLYQKREWNPRWENAFAPALCNRIDRNTGGIVIAANNAEALRILNDKIKHHELEKSYLCITVGRPSPAEGRIEGFLRKDEAKSDAHLLLDPLELDLHVLAQLQIQGAQRLVQQQHLGLVHQGPCDGHPLLLAAGERVRLSVFKALETHDFQHLQDPGADLLFGKADGPLAGGIPGIWNPFEPQAESNIFKDVQMWKKGVLLKHGIDLAPVGGNVINPHTVEQDVSRRGGREAADNAQRGGFTAPAGSEQCEEFLVVDIQIDVIEYRFAVKRHAKVLQADQLFGHVSSPVS